MSDRTVGILAAVGVLALVGLWAWSVANPTRRCIRSHEQDFINPCATMVHTGSVSVCIPATETETVCDAYEERLPDGGWPARASR